MEAAQAHLSVHLSKCNIFGNHVSWLIYVSSYFSVHNIGLDFKVKDVQCVS